jgi:hypothetical protein
MADGVTSRVAAHDFEPSWFPVRITYLRDGVVLDTFVVAEPGALTIDAYGTGVVCVVEFGDGNIEIGRS